MTSDLHRICKILRLVALVLGLVQIASAADGTWNSLTGGTWSTPAKWSGAIADGSGSTANFNTLNLSADITVALDSDRELTNLVFGDTDITTAGSWILSNNSVTTNNLILSGTTPTITVNALGTGKAATISAIIQGTGGFTKAGAGTLTLSAANSYTGITSISAGILKLAATGSLGDGVNNTTGVNLGGSGILDLAGISPAATVPLTLNSSANGFDVGALYNSSATAATFNGAVTLSRHTRIGAGNIKLTGLIVGGGFNLIKDGVSTLELAGSGTVSLGLLQANRGTIQVSSGTTLNVTSINIGSGNSVGAGLNLSGGSVTSSGAVSFGTGSGSASGTLTLNSGVLTVPSLTKGPVTFNILFNGGTLKAGAASATFLTSASAAKVQAGGAIIDDGGFNITITPALIEDTASTGGGLTKLGTGILTLNGANTYTGNTAINAGTLTLGAAASLSVGSGISIAAGATLDVSAIANFTATAPLVATGNGSSPAEIRGGSTINPGTAPLALNFSPTNPNGDSAHPALSVSSGGFVLNGPITIANNSPSPLGPGTYVLVTQVNGTISGTPTFGGVVGGQGIQAGAISFIQKNGGNLELIVDVIHPTTTTVTRQPGTGSSTAYGDTLTFGVNVSPATATGPIELRDGGAGGLLLGTAQLSGGACTITPPDKALSIGSHANIVAVYPGNINHLSSISASLAPAQSVSKKALTIANAAGTNKFFDGTDTATITGSLAGVESGDVVSLVPSGYFASLNPGTNIPVTSTATLSGTSAGNYTLTQPSGLAANIVASNIWTGGAGGTGMDVATGSNYSPTAATGAVYNAIFNGSDPVTTDLTLASTIGGAVATNGMVFGFAGNQVNPVTITGATGATARVTSVLVASGAGAVTFQGAFPFTIGGLGSSNSNHNFSNESANPLVFDTGVNWSPGGSTPLRGLLFNGAGVIIMRGNITSSTTSRVFLTKSGAGTLTLSGANTFSGGTTINAGKIIASTSTAIGAGAVVNQGILDLTAGAVTYTGLSNSLSGSGVNNVTLGTGTASTSLNGNYTGFTGTWNIGVGAAAGAGKVQMNGVDNPAATINVLPNGTLYTNGAAVVHAAALVLNGGDTGETLGQLRIEGSATWAGNITLAGPITGAGDGHIGANTGTGTISGNIGETGGSQELVKDGNGTIILSGINTYTGPTSVNDGILLVNSPGSIAVGSAVTVASGATLGGGGVIHGPVTVASGGILGGSLILNGPVVVDAGGTLDATSTLLPSVNATSTLTLNGYLDLSIDRTRSPSSSNLTISGTLNRGGIMRVINTGPALQLGDSFTVTISAAQLTGSFASTLFPALDYGLVWNTSQFASNGTITVVANTSITTSTVTLTPATTNQQIHGIGANFCLGPQNIAWNTTNFNLAFSPSGLNISFARLANSFECSLDEPNIFFSGWDSDNVRFIQQFRAIQPDGLLTMASWSPPGRFKSTGSANGGTLAKTGSAYRYTDFGNWWLRSLQYLRDNNSTLPVEKAIPDFISIQNECDFTPSGNPFYAAWQAGCYLNSVETTTKAGYPQALAAVKSAFQSDGFGFVKFVGPDTTTASPSVISSYVNNVPAGSFAAIAHHPYQGSINNVGNNTTSISGLRAAYPNSILYMTEFFGDDSYGPNIPGWMQHSLPMHNIFAIEKANTYLMWGLSLSPTSDTFCALGQYSKFIRPGDWRSAATSTDSNVKTTLFRHSVGTGIPDQLILVMINNSAAYNYPTVQTSAHWASDPARRLWQVYKTANDGSTQQRITLTEDISGAALTGNRNLVLAPYSVTTVLINSDAPLTNQEAWRQQYFGSAANVGNAADSFDSNGDGESNFYEFATGQNPSANTRVTPSMLLNGANLEFTYTRSKAAVLDGVTFTAKWSETLAPGSWSTLGIPDQAPPPFAETTTTETLKILVPAGSTRRFVRLEVVQP